MLRINNLTKVIGNKKILDNISVTINENEVVAIIGKNGAGKSTLIRSFLNLIGAFSGDIKLYNKNINQYKRYELARKISYLPQANSSTADLTVTDIVISGRYSSNRSFSLSDKADKDIVERAMELVSISDFKERKISELSGGERQRVYIASSLAQGSKILLLDEPSVFLDPKTSEEIYTIISRLNKAERLTIVIVSHDLNQLLQMRSRLIGLKDGRLFFDINDGNINSRLLDELYDKKFRYIQHPDTGVVQIVP